MPRTKVPHKQLPLGEQLTTVKPLQRVCVDGVEGAVTRVTAKNLRHILPDFWIRPDANPEYELGCRFTQAVTRCP